MSEQSFHPDAIVARGPYLDPRSQGEDQVIVVEYRISGRELYEPARASLNQVIRRACPEAIILARALNDDFKRDFQRNDQTALLRWENDRLKKTLRRVVGQEDLKPWL